MDSALCYKKEARLSDKTRVLSKQEIDCVVGKKGNYQARDCLHIIYLLTPCELGTSFLASSVQYCLRNACNLRLQKTYT